MGIHVSRLPGKEIHMAKRRIEIKSLDPKEDYRCYELEFLFNQALEIRARLLLMAKTKSPYNR